MALDRTNMVSLLDVGSLMGGTAADIMEMGDGYTELSEDWAPTVDSKQYVNMTAKSSTVSGYEFSMSPEREYMNDDFQKKVDTLFKKFPTGAQCETSYYRFYKTDKESGSGTSYAAIRIPVIVAPSSTGGAGGESLKSTIQISGNGDVEEGKITVAESGYTWTKNS